MRIDIAGIGREPDRVSHADFLALMQEIDQLGFDGIWFNEFHFQTPPQPYPSPLLLAASIFACTQRLRVGTSVLVLPLHDPLLLAEQIEQLQWHSGGRFDAGFGRGTDPATFEKLNIDVASTRHRFERALLALKASYQKFGRIHAVKVDGAPVSQVGAPKSCAKRTPTRPTSELTLSKCTCAPNIGSVVEIDSLIGELRLRFDAEATQPSVNRIATFERCTERTAIGFQLVHAV
nr:LLM class flavin-dependent oxidoreductase [Hyphomicrobium sulfonivorans]